MYPHHPQHSTKTGGCGLGEQLGARTVGASQARPRLSMDPDLEDPQKGSHIQFGILGWR